MQESKKRKNFLMSQFNFFQMHVETLLRVNGLRNIYTKYSRILDIKRENERYTKIFKTSNIKVHLFKMN